MEYQQMQAILEKQKAFFIKNGPPSYDLRIDRLNRMKTLIMDNRYKIVDALNEDLALDLKINQWPLMYTLLFQVLSMLRKFKKVDGRI